ncbi:MAG: threonylcarbamoyl-AMP synthase [Acidobacteria bacterium]|nr:threonylcarbamoyl-AMP synthase [Acidobacteriota bacterium]
MVASLVPKQTIRTRDPKDAAELLRRGGVVAFPTETVYGLGAAIFDQDAIRRVFEVKGRPSDNPLIAHIGKIGQIGLLASELSASAERLVESFFPGPLTIVVKKSEVVPSIATAGLTTIGIRMPKSELALAFLKECGTPVVAPSANISGRPSPTTWQAVLEDLDGRIDCILQGEPTDIGLESSVVDCSVEPPLLLRRGAVSIDELRAVVPSVRELASGETGAEKSPGLRHRHYSPRARVAIGTGLPEGFAGRAAFIGMQTPADVFAECLIVNSAEEYAASLFEFFRKCDRGGVELIVCGPVPETGIGAALMDRIRRAAE